MDLGRTTALMFCRSLRRAQMILFGAEPRTARSVIYSYYQDKMNDMKETQDLFP